MGPQALAKKHTAGLSIALTAIWVLSGCAIFGSSAKEGAAKDVNPSEISAGYALLYELVSKEKQVSLLSFIKSESPELKSVLERISEASKATGKELETLAKMKPPLNLKATHLPRIEHATRESIEKETSKQILGSKGVDLEFKMLSSQLAGMNYAAHLARSLAVVETNPLRREFLRRTDRKYSELHVHLYKMLLTRYQR